MLWSEVGDDGYERRKVDEYRDGRLDFADAAHQRGTTWLGDQPMPSLDLINEDPEFTGAAITPDAFETAWRRAHT